MYQQFIHVFCMSASLLFSHPCFFNQPSSLDYCVLSYRCWLAQYMHGKKPAPIVYEAAHSSTLLWEKKTTWIYCFCSPLEIHIQKHEIIAHSSHIRDWNVVSGGGKYLKGSLKHKMPSSFFHSLIFLLLSSLLQEAACVYACFQLLFVQWVNFRAYIGSDKIKELWNGCSLLF